MERERERKKTYLRGRRDLGFGQPNERRTFLSRHVVALTLFLVSRFDVNQRQS